MTEGSLKDEAVDTSPTGETVDLEITDALDLHAFDPRDVSNVVHAYLEEAERRGFTVVRIVHGKGIGVQREIVRSILKKHNLVESFKSGDEMSGGWGATIAVLKRRS